MASSLLSQTRFGCGLSCDFSTSKSPPPTCALSTSGRTIPIICMCTVACKNDIAAPVTKRFSHLSPLLSQLLSASLEDIPRILEPWLSNLTADDWNALVADVGPRSWRNSLSIFHTFKQKSPLWQEHLRQMEAAGLSAPPLLKICTTLVRLLARRQRNEEIAALQKQMEEENIIPDTAFYNALFSMYADCAQADEISKGLLNMEAAGIKPDCLTHELFITASLNEDSPDLPMLESLLQNMINKGVPTSVNVFRKLINGFWEAKDVEGAERVFASMQNASYLPDSKVINKLMQLHGCQGNHKRNLELFNLTKKLNAKHIQTAYGYLIHSYCKAGLLKQARQAFSKFEKVTGCKPALVNFNMIMDAYGKHGFYEEVLEYYGILCNSGLEPNIVSYCTIISAMVTVGKFKKAEHLYKRMLSKDIKPNMHIYLTMIHCYTKSKATRLGREVYFAMRKGRLNLTQTAYSTVLALYVEGQWYDHAASILKRMEREGFELDTAAHALLIRAFGSFNDDMKPLVEAVEASGLDLCKLLSSLSLTTKEGPNQNTCPQKRLGDYLELVETSSKNLNILAIYNAFLDCLWERSLRFSAQFLLKQARENSAASTCPKLDATLWTLDVRGLSIGGSQVAVTEWLGQVKAGILEGSESSSHYTDMVIITGVGDFAHRSVNEVGVQKKGLKGALLCWLQSLASPFAESSENPTKLEASKQNVMKWIQDSIVEKEMNLVDCV